MNPRRRHRGRGPRPVRPVQPQDGSAPSGATGATPAAAAPTAPAPGPRRKTVLVLEDNATIGGLMVALLREEGYRALRAWDVREAVKIARDRKPDLLLLDLSLPYREGLPQLSELRAHPETSEAPIVLVTGNALQLGPGEREQLAECVAKPVDIDRLVNYVRRHVGDPELEIPEKNYSGSADVAMHIW
jgi:chemosensory pili system protein ChpA (sensor histidine kinase/response regulator)